MRLAMVGVLAAIGLQGGGPLLAQGAVALTIAGGSIAQAL